MEVSKSTPTAALFLELSTLPIQYEIEKRQLVFLNKILNRQNDDPVKMIYHEMVKNQLRGTGHTMSMSCVVSTVFLRVTRMFVI